MKGISILFALFFTACASHQDEQADPKKDPIRYGLLSKRDEFRSCYLESESYKGKDAVTSGIIKVGFTINKLGHSTNEKIVETSFKDPNLDACIKGILRLIKFPAPENEGTIDVVQPINFYPRMNN
jgi:hypothetical protein